MTDIETMINDRLDRIETKLDSFIDCINNKIQKTLWSVIVAIFAAVSSFGIQIVKAIAGK
jgi:hypothetical protein